MPTDLTDTHVHAAAPGAVLTNSDFLAPFSTGLSPALIERLRVAAPQIGIRQGEIAAETTGFLRDHDH